MPRYAPQSQTDTVMREKEALARRLLAQGLTVTQICAQLRYNRQFVKQVRDRISVPQDSKTGAESEACC